jgi:hypothetical protein
MLRKGPVNADEKRPTYVLRHLHPVHVMLRKIQILLGIWPHFLLVTSANPTFFSLGIIDGPPFPSSFLEENVQNSQKLNFSSSHSLFIENYLFVQTPSSKFDHLPNSASTPKTHKTIVKYNMVILIIGRQINIPIHVRVIIHGESNTQINVWRKAILPHKISNPHVYVI